MPRIGIDARLYGVGSGTGIGRYVEEAISAFARIAHEEAFVVFLRRDGFRAFDPPNDRWTKVLADFRPYTLGVQTRFPRCIREARVDLMHFTHFDHPIRCPVPFVTTIHDLILRHHPSTRASTLGPLRFWAKYAAYRAVLHHAVTASAHILTPSETIRTQLHKELDVPLHRITATLLGINHVERFQIPDSRFQIPTSPYLLYIGNAYPHKDLAWLIRVWPEVRRDIPDLRLVLVHREDPFTARLRALANDRTHIVFISALPEPELHALISGAFAYVSPSRDEGFDLPTLEACAAGVPVIASDIPVHREVLGSAASIFPTRDAAVLRRAIHSLTDPARRGMLSEQGIARAAPFTWERCARATLEVYRACLVAPEHQHVHHGRGGHG